MYYDPLSHGISVDVSLLLLLCTVWKLSMILCNHPYHPQGLPPSLRVVPQTSTPLPPGQLKLNQRAAQIRGPFCSSRSRLGATAPAHSGYPALFSLKDFPSSF